jgi:hypothetical protein
LAAAESVAAGRVAAGQVAAESVAAGRVAAGQVAAGLAAAEWVVHGQVVAAAERVVHGQVAAAAEWVEPVVERVAPAAEEIELVESAGWAVAELAVAELAVAELAVAEPAAAGLAAAAVVESVAAVAIEAAAAAESHKGLVAESVDLEEPVVVAVAASAAEVVLVLVEPAVEGTALALADHTATQAAAQHIHPAALPHTHTRREVGIHHRILAVVVDGVVVPVAAVAVAVAAVGDTRLRKRDRHCSLVARRGWGSSRTLGALHPALQPNLSASHGE